MTNDGKMYERISSGSFPVSKSAKSQKVERTQSIKDLSALNQLYEKRKDQIRRIKDKIELPEIRIENSVHSKLFAYLDFGFSMVTTDISRTRDKFNKLI